MKVDARIAAFLKERIGLDAGPVGKSTIERAVLQRQRALHATSSAAYWEQLQASVAEQQALIDAVVVPETSFFRYPESFRALVSLALQRAGTVGRPLRLLSAPCSTGEEPYSIAMALLDAGLLPVQFQIDAVDISPQLIARASAGHYRKNSFRGDALAFRDRHFSADELGYQLHPQVQKQVRLRTANLLEPESLRVDALYDFVFCRNLLIYFNLATQESVLATLTRLAHQDGYLFVGPAEASLLSRLGLQGIAAPQSFAFHLKKPAAVSQPVAVAPTTSLPLPRAPARRPSVPARPQPPLSRPATAASNDPIAAIADLANAGKTAEALSLCEQELGRQGPSAPIFYWLGLLNDAAGRALPAQEYYRKALYLDPQHRESLVHLAALLEARGDSAAAKRLQARAARGAGKHV